MEKLTENNITELGRHSTRMKIQDRTSGLNCRLTVGELWQDEEMLQAEQGSTAERPPGERQAGWLVRGSSLGMAPSEEWLG